MNYELTGRRRFRMWKNKMILQVEFFYFQDDCSGHSYAVESRKAYAWRDAALEDLTVDTDVQLNCKEG